MARIDIISNTDSPHVKRSKLISVGLRPKKDKEALIWGLALNYAREQFKMHLKETSIEDFFFNNEKNKYILSIYENIFGSLNKEDSIFNINTINMNFLKENSIYLKDQFSELLTTSLSSNEYNLIPNSFKLYISIELVKFEYKKTYNLYLKFLIENMPGIKDFLSVSEWGIKERDTVKTRHLKDLFDSLNLINKNEKLLIKTEFLNYFKKFEEYCFFEEIDINDIEKQNILRNIENF